MLGGVLGRIHGFKGGPHLKGGFGPHAGARGAVVDDLAKALGITVAQMRERLRDGKSIADIAKAEGKSLDDVRASVKASIKGRLDKAVADGDLTRKQADAMLEKLDHAPQNLDRLRSRHLRPHPRLNLPDRRPGKFMPEPGNGIFS